MCINRCEIAAAVMWTVLLAVATADDVAPQSPQQNLAAELPRIPPKTPAEAIESFSLPPGFRIELVAAEPLVRDPVAMAFDEDCRLYVAELPAYNRYEFQGFGSIKLLEDVDGDGEFDKSGVYLDKVAFPTALACFDGGVLVGSPPDILYCKDTNGDGQADLRRTILTGFARDPAMASMMNSFRWGIQNRIRIATSYAGGDVRSTKQVDTQAVSVRRQDLLLEPRSGTFELTSGGGQHGMSFDDWGRTYVCSNSSPVQMLMFDSRYVARNPFFAPPSSAVKILEGDNTRDVFRKSPLEPWRVARTRLRNQSARGDHEGGKPAGFFTAATGITVYRGDAWPASYQGNVFVGEVANNVIFRAEIETGGIQFVGRRADGDVEFLTSTDIWFRPAQFENGPDGALYVVDVYREFIEAATAIPPAILKHLDPSSGSDQGRIYRIVTDEFKQPQLPRLGNATTEELIALLEHPNGWHRDTAARLLYERQDPRAVDPLKQQLATSASPRTRLHTLWALDGLDALDAEAVWQGLHDLDPRVREHAVRLSERVSNEAASIRTKLYSLVDDEDPRVRFQLAFSLGELQDPRRFEVLARLMTRDASNSWIRMAVNSSLAEGADLVFSRLASDPQFLESDHAEQLLAELAAQIGARNRNCETASIFDDLQGLADNYSALAQVILRRLIRSAQGAAKRELIQSAQQKVGKQLEVLLQQAGQQAVDANSPLEVRVAAIETLGIGTFSEYEPVFAQLLRFESPLPIQIAVLASLAQFDDAAIPRMLLDNWSGLSPKLRLRAIESLFSRPAWIVQLLDAIEQGLVRAGDLEPARIKLLQEHTQSTIRNRATKLFGTESPSRRNEVVEAYQDTLQLPGDTARGRLVFKTACSNCHKLEDMGIELGANLAAIRNRGAEAILLNILDPNREVAPQFLNYVLVTKDGRSQSGVISAETANSVTLHRADGSSEAVLRVNIEELRSTGQSFMPEGLEKEIDKQAMADLLAYLTAAG